MSSQLKTAVVLDDSNIVAGNTIDAANHTTPIGQAESQLQSGQASVSSGDTYVKHLEDAIVGASGKTKVTKLNSGGDESLEVDLDATGVTSGYVPVANGSDDWSWAAQGGGGASPIDVTGTAGEALSERDFVYLDPSDSKWYKVDTDASPVGCSRFRGLVNEAGGISASATGSIRLLGEVTGFTGLTAWSPVYASTTAGSYTQTRPSPTSGGSQVAVIEIGFATSTTAIMLMPPKPIMYMKRDTVANDGTLTVEHHADALGHTRKPLAYIGSLDAGASLTSYGEENQDAYASLQGGDGAGATTSITASGQVRNVGTNSSGSVRDAAQSFQVTAGLFTSFDVEFGANVGSPTGVMNWTLETDSSGPSGTVLTSGSFTPTESTTNTVNVADSAKIFLSASTTYWLTFSSNDTQSNNNYWQIQGSGSSTYANGQRASQVDGGGWSLQTDDLQISVTTSPLDFGQQLAQGFQIASGDTVEVVKLWLKKVGSASGNLTVELQTDSSGDPSGTPVTNGTSNTVAASSLTTSFGYIEFTFATNPTLSGSTQYHIVLKTTATQSNSDFVIWGSDESTPSYSSGQLKSYNGSTWDAESDDAVFDITAEGTTFQEPAVVGRWSGGTRDVAYRYDDGAGASGDTNTTGKNVTGASVDLTLVIAVP